MYSKEENIMILDVFEYELKCISDVGLRDAVTKFLTDAVPDYFFSVSASATGKYHPDFANGEGGLVRHTQMVVAVALELFSIEPYSNLSDTEQDIVIAACLLHDTFKLGKVNTGHTDELHPVLAAEAWKNFYDHNKDDIMCIFNSRDIGDAIRDEVYYCIIGHMGNFGPECAKLVIQNNNRLCVRLVQLCDYIASRKFFDKF